jgi:monofunctional biosynthetic peptidoglycan transglycosylase
MLRRILWISLLLALVPPIWYLADLPNTNLLIKSNPKTTAIRTYREDQIRIKGSKPRTSQAWRNLDQISPYLWQAVMLAEDDAFFQHKGIDYLQLKNAARTNWKRKKFAFGASTITQQLARTLYLSSQKNLLRKAKEALIARRLEKSLSKKRILELYLNTVEWGPQVYGAEAASQHFFQKSALDLTGDEAIALAAILPSPRRWDPHKTDGFMGRRKIILYDRMVRANYIAPPVSPDITEIFESNETLVPPPVENAIPSIEILGPAPEELPAEDGNPEN